MLSQFFLGKARIFSGLPGPGVQVKGPLAKTLSQVNDAAPFDVVPHRLVMACHHLDKHGP